MLCNFPQYRITCIDKSDEMLKMAQMKTQLKGCKFIKGDITEGLPAEMFDGVVTTLTLHHISDSSRKKLVNEIYRALHPRGLFICGDVFKPEEDWIEVIYQSRWENHMRKTGMPEEQIRETLSGREKAWPLIDTMHGFYEKMKTAGFTRIFIPLQYDMFGVFIGMK
jgi:tRNA (cmo5U34)-methyltransferase